MPAFPFPAVIMLRSSLLAAAVAAALAPSARAQTARNDYPVKPVKLVVGFAPGGAVDFLGRLIGDKFREGLGQSMIVENRAGAGGNIATEYVARADPDGYTVLVASFGPITVSPSLYRKLPYDPVRDFTAISNLVAVENVLVVHPSVPAKNVKELIALTRRTRGGITYGSSGVSTTGHLAGELFRQQTGAEMIHVPYKGGAPAMTALLSGEIQAIFATVPTAVQLIRAGKLRALGATGENRLVALPEVPTVAEGGVKGFNVSSWYGLLAPAGTASTIVARLNRESHRVLALADVKEKLLDQGLTPSPSKPEQLAERIRNDIVMWKKVVEKAGIQPE